MWVASHVPELAGPPEFLPGTSFAVELVTSWREKLHDGLPEGVFERFCRDQARALPGVSWEDVTSHWLYLTEVCVCVPSPSASARLHFAHATAPCSRAAYSPRATQARRLVPSSPSDSTRAHSDEQDAS